MEGANDGLLALLEQRNMEGFLDFLQEGRADLEQRYACMVRACQMPQALNFVEALLKTGVDANMLDPHPAESACRRTDLPLLRLLLQQPDLDVNERFSDSGTILMWLCLLECKQSETSLLLDCFSLILDNDQLEVNLPDCHGMQAIMYAAENDYEDRVKLLLKQKRHVLNLDVLLPIAGQTIRDNIATKFPDLRHLLPERLLEDLDSPDLQKRFLAALQHGDLELFRSLSSNVDVNHFYGSPYYFTCLELACQAKRCSEFVKVLLTSGADPISSKKLHLVPLVHYVVASCNSATLEMFINCGSVNIWETDAMKHTPLQVAANRRFTCKEEQAALVECTELLLDLAEKDGDACGIINNQDVWGDTALHDASLYGNDQITLLLLHHGASLTIHNEDGVTPLSNITASVLETFLDERIRSNSTSAISDRYSITFDYGFLRPHVQTEEETLDIMTSPTLQHLLQHPVINSYLQLKWQNIRLFYLLDVFIFLLFVLSMSLYTLLIAYDRHNSSAPVGSILEFMDYHCLSGRTSVLIPVGICRFLYGITLHILIAREFCQLLVQGRQYLHYWRNYLDILIILTSYIQWANPCLAHPLDLHIPAISILLAWTELIILLGHLPTFSVQLMMMNCVAGTFLRFMTWYSLILIPFAISFHILFGGSMEHFASPHSAGIKTVAMFTGDLSADEMAFSLAPVTGHAVFFLFLFLVAIILNNLINGLAVSDTQLIQKNAKVLSLVALVKLVSRTEKSLETIVQWGCCRPLFRSCVLPRTRMYDGPLKKRSKVKVLPNKKGCVLFYDEDSWDGYHICRSITTAASSIVQARKERKGRGRTSHHRREK